MREISAAAIRDAIAQMCVEANKHLPDDLVGILGDARVREADSLAADILGDLLANEKAARELDLPVCQDTGMAVVFADIGRDVHIAGGAFEDAVNAGVAQGYTTGYLRCSVVSDPFERMNTGDNTPAVIHTRIVEGDRLTLTVAPKGFGSENMSAIKMFLPTASKAEVIDFVIDTVRAAGGNPCPPSVLGVGIGGDFESCALMAKRALCLPADSSGSSESSYREMEREIVDKANRLGIGPQGFGGRTTVLYAKILAAPTHIAGLPVAVNVGCHVNRHVTRTL